MENNRLYDYTGRPLEDNEVLVLMPYDEIDVKANCRNPKSIVSVTRGGKMLKAVLKAVPVEWAAVANSQFSSWTEDRRPARTEGRCLIPQEDGTSKPCPRKKGDNRCACVDCPHRGKYERQILAQISLDQLRDEDGYDVAIVDESPEERFFDAFNEKEGLVRANKVLDRLTEISPKHGFAAKLMARGVRGAQFEKQLGLCHYSCDTIRHQVAALAPDGITSFDQLGLDLLKVKRSKRDDYYREASQHLPNITE